MEREVGGLTLAEVLEASPCALVWTADDVDRLDQAWVGSLFVIQRLKGGDAEVVGTAEEDSQWFRARCGLIAISRRLLLSLVEAATMRLPSSEKY